MSKITNVRQFMQFIGTDTLAVEGANGWTFSKYSPKTKLLNTEDNYFLPNTGGLKKQDITRLNCLFLDLDAGRDQNKKYKPLREVRKLKAKMLAKVKEFGDEYFVPTLIVETRNGYQLYWKFMVPESVNQLSMKKWNDMEKRLFSYFKNVGADAKVLKPNQILRLPFTWWNKKKEGMQPYLCSILEQNLTSTVVFNTTYNRLRTINVVPISTDSMYSNTGANRTPYTPYKSKTQAPTPIVLSNFGTPNLIAEVVDFLREIAVQFKYQNKLYTERTALRLADELMKG